MKRAVLIVNPFASRVSEEAISAVERKLMDAAYVRTVRTEHPRHAIELARAAGEADALIVFSGDGGFNEALNGTTFRSASCPAAGRTCSRVRSACRGIRLTRPSASPTRLHTNARVTSPPAV